MILSVSEPRSISIKDGRPRMDALLKQLNEERRAAARRVIAICDGIPSLAAKQSVAELRSRVAELEREQAK